MKINTSLQNVRSGGKPKSPIAEVITINLMISTSNSLRPETLYMPTYSIIRYATKNAGIFTVAWAKICKAPYWTPNGTPVVNANNMYPKCDKVL